MTGIDINQNLAIVSMDASFPGGEGLPDYGRLIYRGLPVEGTFGSALEFDESFRGMIQRVLQNNNSPFEPFAVIALSQRMALAVRNIFPEHAVIETWSASNPLAAALESARQKLISGEAGEALLLDSQEDPPVISAIVLSLMDPEKTGQRGVLAEIYYPGQDSIPSGGLSPLNAHQAMLDYAGISPDEIGLIVTDSLTQSGIQPEEGEQLHNTYPGRGELSCALSGGSKGLSGLLRTAWCLSQRVIPGTPGWRGTYPAAFWRQSPFYVPENSRTWFTSSGQQNRYAVLNTVSSEGSFSPVLLKETAQTLPLSTCAVRKEPFYLFPLAAGSMEQLVIKLTQLKDRLLQNPDFASASRECYNQFVTASPSASVLVCLLAHSAAELSREIGFAVTGIPKAYEKGLDWQTPLGSYFTSKALGEEGGIAFVYAGAFNSYPGVGQDLFYLFPALYDRFSAISPKIGELLHEKMLYPRSFQALTKTDLEELETGLVSDPVAMLISGSSLAVLYTLLLQDVFGIHASSAFGYSLGEISMMFAAGVWTDAEEVSGALIASPLFKTRLSGPQLAVRSYWDMPLDRVDGTREPIWENYLLMTSPDLVLAEIAKEQRVYLTHINTPRQVVIGGDPAVCRRIIERVKCSSLKAPFNYALHCAAITSEYDTMVKLLSWPVSQQPGMSLYSAATCQPMQMETTRSAHQLASVLCTSLDFPRLVQQVYQDGARIFIELGAGSNCARWIDESLHGYPHGAFSIDRKGLDVYSSILRLLARLVCHRVPVKLNALYE